MAKALILIGMMFLASAAYDVIKLLIKEIRKEMKNGTNN